MIKRIRLMSSRYGDGCTRRMFHTVYVDKITHITMQESSSHARVQVVGGDSFSVVESASEIFAIIHDEGYWKWETMPSARDFRDRHKLSHTCKCCAESLGEEIFICNRCSLEGKM